MAESADRPNLTCPVCGMGVDENSIIAGYEGQAYYFCTEKDKVEFLQHPEEYLKKEKVA